MTTNCAHCQQPLQPSWGAQFMTCPHCGEYLELYEANGKLYSFVKENPHKENAQVESKQPNTKQELILQRQHLQNEMLLLQQAWALEQEKYPDRFKRFNSPEQFNYYRTINMVIMFIFTGCIMFYVVFVGMDTDAKIFTLWAVLVVFPLSLFGIIYMDNRAASYCTQLREFQAKRDELGKALKKVEQELARL